MGKHDALTLKEEQFIKENCGKLEIKEMALALGRSYSMIQKTLWLLGYRQVRQWTREDDKYLVENYESMSAQEIAGVLGVRVSRVYNRIRRLKKNGRYGRKRRQ